MAAHKRAPQLRRGSGGESRLSAHPTYSTGPQAAALLKTLSAQKKNRMVDIITKDRVHADSSDMARRSSEERRPGKMVARPEKGRGLLGTIAHVVKPGGAIDKTFESVVTSAYEHTPRLVKLAAKYTGAEDMAKGGWWSLTHPADRIAGRGMSAEQQMTVPFAGRPAPVSAETIARFSGPAKHRLLEKGMPTAEADRVIKAASDDLATGQHGTSPGAFDTLVNKHAGVDVVRKKFPEYKKQIDESVDSADRINFGPPDELRAVLQKKMTPKEYEAYTLFATEGYRKASVAKRMGVSRQRVDTLLGAGQYKVQAAMKELGVEMSPEEIAGIFSAKRTPKPQGELRYGR